MINSTENLDKKEASWNHEGKKVETYKDRLQGQEIGKAETQKDREEATKLLEKIKSDDKKETHTQETNSTKTTSLSPEITKSIENLNRPEAKAGIQKSYETIQSDIQNGKNDKNRIARGLGNLINKLLW